MCHAADKTTKTGAGNPGRAGTRGQLLSVSDADSVAFLGMLLFCGLAEEEYVGRPNLYSTAMDWRGFFRNIFASFAYPNDSS